MQVYTEPLEKTGECFQLCVLTKMLDVAFQSLARSQGSHFHRWYQVDGHQTTGQWLWILPGQPDTGLMANNVHPCGEQLAFQGHFQDEPLGEPLGLRSC